MSKIEYSFRIEKKVYSVQLEAQARDDGTTVFSADDLLREQWRLGKSFVEESNDSESVSCELFNFLVDISGMANSEFASYIGIEPATISH